MKKTSRILAFLMAALFLCLAFTACGKKDGGADPFSFVYNDATVKIGDSEEEALKALGNWASYNLSESCGGFAGKDYIYYYKGFSVYTTPDRNGNIINMIELTSDEVAIPNGLTIGSSRKDVVKAMGSEGTAQGESLVYTNGTVKLTFILRDDSVTNIQYTSAV